MVLRMPIVLELQIYGDSPVLPNLRKAIIVPDVLNIPANGHST